MEYNTVLVRRALYIPPTPFWLSSCLFVVTHFSWTRRISPLLRVSISLSDTRVTKIIILPIEVASQASSTEVSHSSFSLPFSPSSHLSASIAFGGVSDKGQGVCISVYTRIVALQQSMGQLEASLGGVQEQGEVPMAFPIVVALSSSSGGLLFTTIRLCREQDSSARGGGKTASFPPPR